jgi:hypothetical protein
MVTWWRLSGLSGMHRGFGICTAALRRICAEAERRGVRESQLLPQKNRDLLL